MEDRQILVGVLIGNLIIHAKRTKSRLLMKRDIEKVYDQVDWSFVDFVCEN